MKRIIGLDFGHQRIGVAICDPSRTIASPLKVVERSETTIADLTKLFETHEVERVVLGLPLNLDGKEGRAAIAVKQFAKKLEKQSKLPIEFIDERFTTAQAGRILREARSSSKTRKKTIDSMAAAIILQTYLDQRPPCA